MIPWKAKLTNKEILRPVNKQRELIEVIKKRKTAYRGHIMRNTNYRLLHLLIEGKIERCRGIGRKKMPWLRKISGQGYTMYVILAKTKKNPSEPSLISQYYIGKTILPPSDPVQPSIS